MMEAITTKYCGPTNRSWARIKVSCNRGTMFVPYQDQLRMEEAHRYAVTQLVNRFIAEDEKKSTPEDPIVSPWRKPFFMEELPKGGYVAVQLDLTVENIVEAARMVVKHWSDKGLAAAVHHLDFSLDEFDTQFVNSEGGK